MPEKLNVNSPLVILHGDEMAQVAFTHVLERFVVSRLNIELVELDLSAENRLLTNGQVVRDAIEALKTHGVGVKNAGMTVNRDQLDELLTRHPELKEDELHKLATQSPNGAIRNGIGGNITREDIEFRNIRKNPPDWIGRDIVVDTMHTGGIKGSHNELSTATGIVKLMFVGASGDPVELHRRRINKGDPWLVACNSIEKVREWAHRFFQRALEEERDIYLGLKDTVIPGYDGVMREAIEDIYASDYQDRVESAGLRYQYELIDAQAARLVANPPDRPALWGLPENTSGRKLYKLVEQLKIYGIPARDSQTSIARMSSGGGDQYGSFNMAMAEDGIVKVVVDGEEKHARDVRQGDPVLFMGNERRAIKDWVKQVFRDAAYKHKEIYFGLKREYMDYDDVFSQVIAEVRTELAESGDPVPSFMIMRPSRQLRKMVIDPPSTALYPALNLDGDIFSDISAALGGSLATASSIIASVDGTVLFEAPHGTAHDLFLRYQETNGEQAHFNSSALLFAVANALEAMALRDGNDDLKRYAIGVKGALIDTVEQGIVTADIRGKTTNPDREKVVDMIGFLDAIEGNL